MESLNVFHPEAKKAFCTEVTEHGQATHFVHEIIWGATVVVSFESELSSEDERADVQGSLHAILNWMAAAVEGKAHAQVTDCIDKAFAKRFKITVSGDLMPPVEAERPHTLAGVINFMLKEVPTYFPHALNGRGRALSYGLYPLAPFGQDAARIVEHLSQEASIVRLEYAVDEFRQKKARLNELYADVQRIAAVLPDSLLEKVQSFLAEVGIAEASFRNAIGRAALLARTESGNVPTIESILKDFAQSPYSASNITKWLQEHYPKLQPFLNTYSHLADLQIRLIDKNITPESVVMRCATTNLYILYTSTSFESELSRKSWAAFTKLAKETQDSTFVVFDFDTHPYVAV